MSISQALIISYFSVASAFLPFTIGLIVLRLRLANVLLKALALLISLALLIDILVLKLRSLNNDLGNLYRLFEFILLLWIYYSAFENKARKSFIFIGLAYFAFFVFDVFFIQPGQLSSFSITVTSVVFMILSVVYFYWLMSELPTTQIQRLPMFWINTAVLIYFAGSFFVFLLRNYLVEVLKDDQIIYWSFHNFLNIAKNILFAVGLWQAVRKINTV